MKDGPDRFHEQPKQREVGPLEAAMFAQTFYRLATWCLLSGTCLAQQDLDLVGHWKLTGDCRDYSGQGNHAVNHGVDLTAADGARFDGIEQFIEVPVTDALRLGQKDFSIAVWVHTQAELSDVLGDILSQYDPATRTGFTLGLLNYSGVTSSQSNYRNLSFGIDAGRVERAWTDRGRPGNARFVMPIVETQPMTRARRPTQERDSPQLGPARLPRRATVAGRAIPGGAGASQYLVRSEA